MVGSTEYLFEIDNATNASTDTTLVAISGVGGTHPATNRYEIDSYSGTRQRWGDGLALDGIITGDGGDADQFIDAGQGYDVTLGLRNLFSLQAGQSGTYVATTMYLLAGLFTTPMLQLSTTLARWPVLVQSAARSRERRSEVMSSPGLLGIV